MAARRKKPEPKEEPQVPCGYGCGNMAEGFLQLSYNRWSDPNDRDNNRRYESGFSVHLPACRACVKSAVQIKVDIPSAEHTVASKRV